MLFFTYTTFNIQSFIGCIMLEGIVVNNAILLVDHTNLLRRLGSDTGSGKPSKRRDGGDCNPILMTALTTIIGLLPLALGLGEGGEAKAPMAGRHRRIVQLDADYPSVCACGLFHI